MVAGLVCLQVYSRRQHIFNVIRLNQASDTTPTLPKRVYTRAHASARFVADELDPMHITQQLLLPPDTQCRKGEPRLIRTRSGNVEVRTPCRFGGWTMSSERWVTSPRLHIHLQWLLDQLEPLHKEIREFLADGVDADFFCFSSGATDVPPSIPRDVRSRAHALGFTIEIDHYNTLDGNGG